MKIVKRILPALLILALTACAPSAQEASPSPEAQPLVLAAVTSGGEPNFRALEAECGVELAIVEYESAQQLAEAAANGAQADLFYLPDCPENYPELDGLLEDLAPRLAEGELLVPQLRSAMEARSGALYSLPCGFQLYAFYTEPGSPTAGELTPYFPYYWDREMVFGWLDAFSPVFPDPAEMDEAQLHELLTACRIHPEEADSAAGSQLYLLQCGGGLEMLAGISGGFEAVTLPGATSPGIFSVSGCLGVFSGSSNKDAAFELARAAVASEPEWNGAAGALPASAKALEAELSSLEGAIPPENLETFRALLGGTTAVDLPCGYAVGAALRQQLAEG